jgi:hypothetical protein
VAKSQIDEQRNFFQKRFGGLFSYRLELSAVSDELVYADINTALCFAGWLAAKQDEQNTKVGDSIETPSGLFQVMKHPDSVDDSGITSAGLIRSFCAYCGSGNHDHLPNCKGARG